MRNLDSIDITEWELAEADLDPFRENHTVTLLIDAAHNRRLILMLAIIDSHLAEPLFHGIYQPSTASLSKKMQLLRVA